MEDKKIFIQSSHTTPGEFDITCPYCSTCSAVKSDELELENLFCPNCSAKLPLANLEFLLFDGSPIEDEDYLDDANELKEFGTSIPDILSHRGKEEDSSLAYSIGFQLMEKIEKYGIENLTNEEKWFYAVYELDNEVNNGGYLQYFDNSSGDLAYLIIDALQTIGSKKVLESTKSALDIYGKMPSKDREERMNEITTITNDYENNLWDECDSFFYDIEDENIESLLIDYVASNNKKFKL